MANPYLPIVARAAAQYHVPADLLAALLQQESGFNPHARSSAGAEGIAQFMPGTARGMGVNPWDPNSAIPGAARYISNALKTNHGDIRLALASYNAGQGAVNQYGGIPPFAETQNYVRSILAGRSRFPGLANGTYAGGVPAAPPTPTNPTMPQAPAALPQLPTMQETLNPAYARITGLQQLISQNAQNAHIPTLNLPLPPMLTMTQLAQPTSGTPTTSGTTGFPQPGGGALPNIRGGIYSRPHLGRTDMGVDYTGAGPIPALGDGIVTRVVGRGGPSGWPGGGFVTYQLTSGPYRGRFVYVAENISPTVRVGQRVVAGQQIATAYGTSPYTESGWSANAEGTTLAHATTGYHEGEVTPAGRSFLAFLHSLGLA